MRLRSTVYGLRSTIKCLQSTVYRLRSTVVRSLPADSKGYSLIELLVVITLIGIISTIIFQMFMLTLHYQVKSEVIKEVKQNGDYASSIMETMIRNASDISSAGCNINQGSITFTNADGFTTTFACTGTIASTSAYPNPTPAVSVNLTGPKVAASNCNFRVVCPTPPLSPKYVFISFTLSQVNPTGSVEQKAAIDYQSTVSLRTYQ
jgi:prepilin-type N-terminal cleavage/methylation domain-containing protein